MWDDDNVFAGIESVTTIVSSERCVELPGDEHVRPEIRALVERGEAGERFTYAEWQALRMNSYERDRFMPFLSDEALCALAEHTLRNCINHRRPCITYDAAVTELIAPLLIARLRGRL